MIKPSRIAQRLATFWLWSIAFGILLKLVVFGAMFFLLPDLSDVGRPLFVGVSLAAMNIEALFFAMWLYRRQIPDLIVLRRNKDGVAVYRRRNKQLDCVQAVEVGTTSQEDLGGSYTVALRYGPYNVSQTLVNAGSKKDALEAAQYISEFLDLPIEG